MLACNAGEPTKMSTAVPGKTLQSSPVHHSLAVEPAVHTDENGGSDAVHSDAQTVYRETDMVVRIRPSESIVATLGLWRNVHTGKNPALAREGPPTGLNSSSMSH